MSGDFERIRQSVAQSQMNRFFETGRDVLAAAWDSSVAGSRMRALGRDVPAAPESARVRWPATVMSVAATGHLVLRAFLPATIAPALPPVMIAAIAVGAGIVAWKAAAFQQAWWQSRLARLFD